jgi:hypothetical protein
VTHILVIIAWSPQSLPYPFVVADVTYCWYLLLLLAFGCRAVDVTLATLLHFHTLDIMCQCSALPNPCCFCCIGKQLLLPLAFVACFGCRTVDVMPAALWHFHVPLDTLLHAANWQHAAASVDASGSFMNAVDSINPGGSQPAL